MNRRRTLWPLAAGGLAAGVSAVGIGTTVGGEVGPLVAGYGMLLGLAAVYLAAGLAIRDRAWRRLGTARRPHPPVTPALHRRRAT